jgi:hypothetical protein
MENDGDMLTTKPVVVRGTGARGGEKRGARQDDGESEEGYEI